jgi:hypothetical protein
MGPLSMVNKRCIFGTLSSPNFSLEFPKSGRPSTACQQDLPDLGRYSSDFFLFSLLFFSLTFYEYDAYRRRPLERKQKKPAPSFIKVKGMKIDPSGFLTLCLVGPWPTRLMLRSQIWKGLFSHLSPFSIHSLGLLACQGNRFNI